MVVRSNHISQHSNSVLTYGFRGKKPKAAMRQCLFLLYFIVYAITLVPTSSLFAHFHLVAASPSLRPSPRHCPFPRVMKSWAMGHGSWVMHVCSLANPFTFFPPVPTPRPDSCQSAPCIHTSVSIFSSVYLVHYISHITEIIRCLSFTAWVISLNIILSRSTHAVAKGKISELLPFAS